MKKALSVILAVVMLMGILNVGVFAADIETPTVTASNAVNGGINVYWTAVEGAVKYNVYRRIGGSSSWILVGSTDGKTNLIDPGVEGGKFYVYSVRAYEESGEYSVFDTTKAYTVKCVEVPKLTKLVNTTNGLQVTWNAVAGANNYRIYRRGAGSTSWLYLGTTTSTTFTDGKASSGAYWRYTVRAVGNGYYSGFDTTGLYTIRLANPFSIKASVGTDGVNVTWAKITGATGYRVYRRGAGQTYWTYLGATTGNTFVDKKVVVNQYYRYTVRATRGNIYSDFYTNSPAIKFATPIKNHLPLEMYFSSGAGGWATGLELRKDLSFIGVFHDSDMGDSGYSYPNGTVYICSFTGKLKNAKQINNYKYTLTLDSCKTEVKPNTTWIEDGIRYIATSPYGIGDGGKNYILYTPDTPLSVFPEDAYAWAGYYSGSENGYLNAYCLYCVDNGNAFFTSGYDF